MSEDKTGERALVEKLIRVRSVQVEDSFCRKVLDEAISALSQPKPIPREGEWVKVPREITLEMQHAYFEVIDRNLRRVETDAAFGRYASQQQAYRAMLAAAPPHDGRGELEALHRELSRANQFHELASTRANEAEAQVAELLTMTGCKDAADLQDMANVGNSMMERMSDVILSEGSFKGWSPADDPAEIVTDLWNAVEEAQSTIATLTAQLSALEEAGKPFVNAAELFSDERYSGFPACIYSPAAGNEYSLSSDDLRALRAAHEALRSNTKQEGKALLEETK